ncbi:hypothetical protein CGLO_03045 [Colletotrichum gloeosporioides Cg-14]|uniref:Uncharacterized protein n=1 Tax=Colletotrichum gloeosporioides (strain Cg-14) TaxID=1237896 RepID=T0LZ70_COLGC|nr:hypothetical protein CGLO_03045 [Colletotrichum gloeosporioides Cg-14]
MVVAQLCITAGQHRYWHKREKVKETERADELREGGRKLRCCKTLSVSNVHADEHALCER